MHPYIHTSIHTSIHPYIHTYIHAYIHTSIHPLLHYITLHTLHYITSHHITLHYITYIFIHIHSYLDVYILYIDTHILESAAVYEMHQLFAGWKVIFGTHVSLAFSSTHPKWAILFTWPSFLATAAWLERLRIAQKLPDWKSLLKPSGGQPESRWESCLEACAQIGALLAYHGTKWWLWMVKRFMGPAFSSMVFTKTGVVI